MDREKGVSYQLRKAAGVYWLIDMDQKGVPFKKPIPVNEMGADIWRLLEQGNKEEAAEWLCEEYEIGQEQAAHDMELFLYELRQRGIFV